MSIGEVFQGTLFAGDLLNEAGVRSADWLALDDDVVDGLGASFRTLFERFPIAQAPNESQTEDDLIWPVLQTPRVEREPPPAELVRPRSGGRSGWSAIRG